MKKIKTLKEWRESKEITQKDLAIFLGLASPSTISMWESAARQPDLKNAKKVAAFFETNIENIFFGSSVHE